MLELYSLIYSKIMYWLIRFKFRNNKNKFLNLNFSNEDALFISDTNNHCIRIIYL